jgi:hypothetical protein
VLRSFDEEPELAGEREHDAGITKGALSTAPFVVLQGGRKHIEPLTTVRRGCQGNPNIRDSNNVNES